MDGQWDREWASRQAVQLFADRCNCAQAVFGTFAPKLGLDRSAAIRLATGFGVGLAMGQTCGAVSGAVMALGLAHGGGGPDGDEAKGLTYALAGEFFDAFRAAHGSVCCRELIGCDPSTPEGLRLARAEDRFSRICEGVVAHAAAIVADMLSGREPAP